MTIVRVTADHLKNGIYTDAYDCPIARGLKQAFPKCRVVVSAYGFRLDGEWTSFDTISRGLVKASNDIIFGQARPFWFRVRQEP